MAKGLERDLGLYAVVTISIGAMIGSGIFVLPGIAATIAGPAVVLAYLLAGLVVLPAALSKAEMATAMPQAGGTYLYIDRALGPMAGTIAGIGVWFSLVFKSSFALVGLGAYLVLFTTVSPKLVALGLALVLVLVNILGVKQTGRFQAILVTGVLGVLLFFIGRGLPGAQSANFQPFLDTGLDGLLAATGFVFVSYAGVTKIASVAEEVEDPARNIPRGMLFSIGLMMVVYTLIVLVIVGAVTPDDLGKTLTPMADAADVFMGRFGFVLISVTAVLALTSMANAGLLSSSRYPLAMSRNELAPRSFQAISERFRTPVAAIVVTGAAMMVLIALVPVVQLAKLASAFQLLIFVFINVAVIVFREGQAAWYQPTFRSPLYPWVQLFGILGGLVLLTQMGSVPLIGAVTLIVVGMAWYLFYARRRTAREGVGVDTLRRSAATRMVEQTRVALHEKDGNLVLVPVSKGIDSAREATLLRIAADIVRAQGGAIHVVRFDEVPDQVDLEYAAAEKTAAELRFEEDTSALSRALEVEVTVGEIVSHDTPRAVVNYAARHGVDLVVADAEMGPRSARLFGRGLGAFLARAPSDLVLVKQNAGLNGIRSVAVTSARGPFDPIKVRLANALALESGAPVRLVQSVDIRASDAQLEAIRVYHEGLGELCTVPTESVILREEDWVQALVRAVDEDDVVIVGATTRGFLQRSLRGNPSRQIASNVRATTLIVAPWESRPRSFLRRTVERFLY